LRAGAGVLLPWDRCAWPSGNSPLLDLGAAAEAHPHAKFDRSWSNGVDLSMVHDPKAFVRLSTVTLGWWTPSPRKNVLPQMCYYVEFSRSTYVGVRICRSAAKIGPSRSVTQGHSRSLEPTPVDRPPMNVH